MNDLVDTNLSATFNTQSLTAPRWIRSEFDEWFQIKVAWFNFETGSSKKFPEKLIIFQANFLKLIKHYSAIDTLYWLSSIHDIQIHDWDSTRIEISDHIIWLMQIKLHCWFMTCRWKWARCNFLSKSIWNSNFWNLDEDTNSKLLVFFRILVEVKTH